jgi:hypothetical protein
MAPHDLCEIVGNLERITDPVRVRPPLRACVHNVSDLEVAQPGGTMSGVITVWNSNSRILVCSEVIAEVDGIESIETDPEFVEGCGGECVIVADRGVVVPGR